MKRIAYLILVLWTAMSCQQKPTKENVSTEKDIRARIRLINEQLIEATKAKDVDHAMDFYLDDAILLAEYNPLIDGKELIKRFYTETFDRQSITDYTKATTEVYNFEGTVLEIGTFKKMFVNQDVYEGKYWNFWKKLKNGDLKLITEAFGYNHPIENADALRVLSIQDSTKGLSSRNGKIIPIELEAYDARNENIVRDRDTENVVNSYTDDGAYYPYATPVKAGKAELLKHYTDYHAGPVKIDSIEVWTYDYHPVDDGIFKCGKFYVDWTVPNFSGNTQGTGLIYYRREKDHSLKIHRQIGLHIL